ncbi:MAG: hypothetical protein LBE55_04820 [Clostridiales bacterium]|nr:hypothetical protein [Clostridiales bacterium]
MKNHKGMTFGTSFGVVGSVLLGILVHSAFWGLLPLGICLGLIYDYLKKDKGNKNNHDTTV